MSRSSAKPPSQRQRRVAEQIRHALAQALERGEFYNPVLNARPVTVTEVDVSPDLRNATVFVTPLGGGDATEVLAALKAVRAPMRHHLAGAMTLKYVPDLRFRADRSFDSYDRIGNLLRDPHVAQDLVDAPGDASEDH